MCRKDGHAKEISQPSWGPFLFGRRAELPACPDRASIAPMPEPISPTRQKKIPLAEMRVSGVRGLLVHCADYHCAHAVRIGADRWPDMFGCLISSRCSSVRRAAKGVPISGAIGIGNYRDGARVAERGRSLLLVACSRFLPILASQYPGAALRLPFEVKPKFCAFVSDRFPV